MPAAFPQLKSIVHFTAVPAGAMAVIAHGLNNGYRAVVPDECKPSNANFTFISADDTFITFRNDGVVPMDCDVLCESWHTIERAFGATQISSLVPAPFVAENGIATNFAAIRTVQAHGGSTGTGPLISFADSNGVTFGISGNTITASVQTVGGTATGVVISAGSEIATTGVVVFSNSNNVTFGMHLSTVTASFYQPSVSKIVGYTASGGETDFSVTFPSVGATNYSVFGQLNGVSMIFGLDTPAGGANRAATAFRAIPTASLQAGDQIAFFLVAS